MEGDGIVDEDIPIRATVTIYGDSMTIDFAGTSGQVRGNINCPLPVTRSACYFALRVLLPKDILANAGTYAPLEIKAPEGSLVNATYPLRRSSRGTSRRATASPTPSSRPSPASPRKTSLRRARAR